MADNASNMSQGIEDIGVENVDYVVINGRRLTPSHVEGSIAELRRKNFDLELVALPIVRESDRVIRPEDLTETERERLNNMVYDLSRGQVGDRRFHTEFDFYSALIRATEDNADKVAVLKRKVYAAYAAVNAKYGKLYNYCIVEHGLKEMGSNTEERHAWFQDKYPALAEINTMYDDFLGEVTIELERWQDFAKSASRGLSSTELSYQASGKLYNHKRGSYLAD